MRQRAAKTTKHFKTKKDLITENCWKMTINDFLCWGSCQERDQILLLYLWTFTALIQLQCKEYYNRVKELAVAEDTNIQYFTIAFWNHLKYLNYLYAALFPHPSFCLCLLCCVLMFLLFIILSLTDTRFTFFLWSTVEKPTHNHLLISAQIPAPPAVWMVPTFDIFPCS